MMTPTNHILIVPLSAPSHLRLLVQFSLNLLELHPSLVMTMLISSITTPRLKQELNLQPKALISRLQSRFRWIETEDGLEKGSTTFEEHQAVQRSAGPLFELVLSGKGEGHFASIPCLVICDVGIRS